MKAYCINLARRPDRLEHMSRECARIGLAFDRIEAVDGTTPAVALAATLCPLTSLGERMSAAAYGCLQSHRSAWRRIVNSGDGFGMVLEDDMHLADGLALYASENWIPDPAQLIKLETWGTRVHLDRETHPVPGGRSLIKLRSGHIGAGAYILSSDLARTLLEQSQNCGEPVDEFLFGDPPRAFIGASVYQMVPAPAAQAKRPTAGSGPKTNGAGWVKPSITERFAPGGVIAARTEGVLEKLGRRVREETRARLQGTRYTVVPFG